MEPTILQDILRTQTTRLQNHGLEYGLALHLALEGLCRAASVGCSARQGLAVRARLRWAARVLQQEHEGDCPRPEQTRALPSCAT